MKKIIPLALILVLPLCAFADSNELPLGPIPSTSFNIWELLIKALNWFFNIVIIVAAIFLVYAGFTFITAGGDPEKTKKSLNIVIYSLIGVAIAILAKALINFVSQMLLNKPLFQ